MLGITFACLRNRSISASCPNPSRRQSSQTKNDACGRKGTMPISSESRKKSSTARMFASRYLFRASSQAVSRRYAATVASSVKMDGSFTQVIKPGVDYVLLGTCKGYLNVKQEISLPWDTNESIDSTLQFPLPPINIPVLIDNIFYEFDKATLTDASTEALDKLVVMLNENPNITIGLPRQ